MSASYSEICENARLARENALLGQYDSALVYYQGVLTQIQKLMIQVKEPSRKQKWQVVSIKFIWLEHLSFCCICFIYFCVIVYSLCICITCYHSLPNTW